jgi:hypothetical protein
MADGVHARMHDVEAAGLNAPGDRRLAQSEREQLPPSDDAMLPSSNPGKSLLGR